MRGAFRNYLGKQAAQPAHDNELETFLAGALRIEPREIAIALSALARNGSYSVYEVRLSEAQIQEHGLGTAWSLSRSRAAVVGAF